MFFMVAIDINECDTSPCSSDATCSNTDGSFQCTCNNGFSGNGTTCTGIKIVLIYWIAEIYLFNVTFSWIISKTKFLFIFLFIAIIDINECASSSCSSDATCSNTDGSFQCACNNGFNGDGTTCTGKKIF